MICIQLVWFSTYNRLPGEDSMKNYWQNSIANKLWLYFIMNHDGCGSFGCDKERRFATKQMKERKTFLIKFVIKDVRGWGDVFFRLENIPATKCGFVKFSSYPFFYPSCHDNKSVGLWWVCRDRSGSWKTFFLSSKPCSAWCSLSFLSFIINHSTELCFSHFIHGC